MTSSFTSFQLSATPNLHHKDQSHKPPTPDKEEEENKNFLVVITSHVPRDMAPIALQPVVQDFHQTLTKDETNVEVTEIFEDSETDERWLVQSPYTEREHQLDLETLDHENALLARALSGFQVLRPDYATAPYIDSFNWPDVIAEVKRLSQKSGKGFKETSFYIVAFRSQIKATIEYADLGVLDKAAHGEAVASGGFLK